VIPHFLYKINTNKEESFLRRLGILALLFISKAGAGFLEVFELVSVEE